MRQAYGVPYQGSKNRICRELVEQMPAAENFYDIFAGGCSVTGAAIISGKYKNFYMNDLRDTPKLFLDAIQGGYKDEKRWISREEFLKSTDPYVKYCWGFGNVGKSYIYSKDMEPYKEALWEAVVNDKWDLMFERIPEVAQRCKDKLDNITDTTERRKVNQNEIRDWIIEQCKSEEGLKNIQSHRFYKNYRVNKSLTGKTISRRPHSLESLECLERLQSLERLQNLVSSQRFNITKGDYTNIEIKPHSVIYCDPPYKDTFGYGVSFDYDKFYDWCLQQNNPVFISEYNMPEDKFDCIWSKTTHRKASSTKNTLLTEKLFTPKL